MTDQVVPSAEVVEVRGFPVAVDRAYDTDTHLWVRALEPDRLRVGMDALGLETSGTLAGLSFVPVGSEVAYGESFGTLEAAKFVGPLTAPVSGVVVAVNDDVLRDPSLVERDPYVSGWLVELAVPDAEGAAARLLSDRADVLAWFARTADGYRLEGVIAE